MLLEEIYAQVKAVKRKFIEGRDSISILHKLAHLYYLISDFPGNSYGELSDSDGYGG